MSKKNWNVTPPDIGTIIEAGKQRLKAASDGEDFFQKIPAGIPQNGKIEEWYWKNFGHIINTDCVKLAFLKEGYTPADPASVAKYHSQSAKIMKNLIESMLNGGLAEDAVVILMAGGNGSGKSTFCDGIRHCIGQHWVIDATMASFIAAYDTLHRIYETRRKAVIVHIRRPIEDAWTNGVLKRAAHGSHCTPRPVFEQTHAVVADHVNRLESAFKSNGLIVYRIDNL